MMLESTLLEEKSRRETRLSTSHQRSKDSSLKRDSEGSDLKRETSLPSSSKSRKIELSTIRFSPSPSRKEKLMLKPPRKERMKPLLNPRKLPPLKPKPSKVLPRLLMPPRPLL